MSYTYCLPACAVLGSIEEYGRYPAELEFELHVRNSNYNYQIEFLWETGQLYGCPYFPDHQKGDVYKFGLWADRPVRESRDEAFQKSMESLHGLATKDGKRSPAAQISMGRGRVSVAHLTEDQQLQVALWQSLGGMPPKLCHSATWSC